MEAAESRLGDAVNVLDGVGLSFPDIVIGDRILGGETPKTDGMRRNTALDYETEFQKLSGLKDALLRLCRPGGTVRITNDGNMAAFTAAAELAHSADTALSDGVIAHSLGTDLGTGWLTAEGTIPALPLELAARRLHDTGGRIAYHPNAAAGSAQALPRTSDALRRGRGRGGRGRLP